MMVAVSMWAAGFIENRPKAIALFNNPDIAFQQETLATGVTSSRRHSFAGRNYRVPIENATPTLHKRLRRYSVAGTGRRLAEIELYAIRFNWNPRRYCRLADPIIRRFLLQVRSKKTKLQRLVWHVELSFFNRLSERLAQNRAF